MICPECRTRSLIMRIVALDHYACCPEPACGYYNGPIPHDPDAGPGMAFA